MKRIIGAAAMVVDGQAWGLAPGEPAEQVADGFDPRELCP